MAGAELWDIVMLCAASAAMAALICCFAAKLGGALGVMDRPDGRRKLHRGEVPLVGGLGLLLPAFVTTIVYYLSFPVAATMLFALAAALAVLTIGIIDDRTGLSPIARVAALTVVIVAVLAADPLFILHVLEFKIFGLKLALSLPWLIAAPFGVLMILGFVNAANMADGMNGQLLGSVMLWSGFIVHYLGFALGLPFLALICSGAVVFGFNLRGRLFAGSSGAYAASLFVGLGAIATYRIAGGGMAAEVPIYWFWLPVLDCVRLMVRRSLEGRSPFSADRMHFHHLLIGHLRPSQALFAYLALLAAPGMAAMINSTVAGMTLLFCIGCYGLVIAVARRAALPEEGSDVPIESLPPGTLARAAQFGGLRRARARIHS
ncbi:MAG: hypothetical protein ACREFW_07000 [Rhizomicrobium sp.]